MHISFGNYLFTLFKEFMSKHPYQYLFNDLLKMYVLNLNRKLALQSLFLFVLEK